MIWIFLVTIIFLAVAMYVAAPLLRPAGVAVEGVDQDARELAARRDALVNALKELELDRELEKLSAADYAAERAQIESELAGVLHALQGADD